MHDLRTSRRALLGASGALVVGFSLRPLLAQAQQGAASPKPVVIDEVDSYLALGADGRVTVFSGKVDLGTGIRTA
ncbi:MAG: hypothetical protein JOZ05_02050, partial [Acetobacteraceae bacterium]|nr:hypothetical protein [Acetobacteraceae bacterium]